MAGAFYPPPPPFIGGTQPDAPRLGLAQSGPTPQPPPISGPLVAATFALLIASWTPGPQLPQGSPKFTYPVVSPPPVKTTSLLSAIRSTWEPPFIVPQVGANIAPILPIVSQPPPVGRTSSIRQTWDQIPPLPQVGADIAPLIPTGATSSQPTPISAAIAFAIRSTWEPPAPLPPQGANIAPTLPIISQPQPVSTAQLFAIRSSWEITPQSPQLGTKVAPLIPVLATSPPVSSQSLFFQIRSTWDAAPPPSQGETDIAPLIPAPVISQIPVSLAQAAWIIDSWTDRSVTIITTTAIAASSAAAPIAPPTPNSAPYLTIRSSWDIQLPLPTRTVSSAQSGPPPVVPQPTPNAQLLFTILESWLPPFVLPPVAAAIATQPIVSAPPIVSVAPLANLLAINQPPAYAIPKAGTIASWLPPAGAPSQPQPVSSATLFEIVRSWDPPVWWPLPSLRLLPQSGPAQPIPIPSNGATQRLIIDSWAPAPLPVQPFLELDQIAPLLPLPAGPPAGQRALLRLLLQSWDVQAQPRQALHFVNPGPPAPPPTARLGLRLKIVTYRERLMRLWDIRFGANLHTPSVMRLSAPSVIRLKAVRAK
jgi:hypothetical protein